MKQLVVDDDDVKRLAPFFDSKLGEKLINPVLSFLSIDKVNAVYSRCCHKRGAEFASLLLKDFNINLKVNNADILENLPSGAFIIVSNHPFGALDGISLVSLLGGIRSDFKVMVNNILTYIDAMSPSFIAVEPYSGDKGKSTNLKGIKDTLKHLQDGHPVGFFPAGGVSGIRKNLKIEDPVWAETIVRIIKQSKVEVIPVFFHGYNSKFFYSLGIISWKLRMFRLPSEVFRKLNSTIELTVGEPISAQKIAEFKDNKELASFLRSKTYELKRS